MKRLRQHHISFQHAWDGVKWAFSTQPNFLVHTSLTILAIIMGIIVRLSNVEWTILVLTFCFGFGIEMVNTAIESVTDLVTSEYRKEAKIAKDVAAGMMLVTAIGAVTVAGFIFIPKLLRLISS